MLDKELLLKNDSFFFEHYKKERELFNKLSIYNSDTDNSKPLSINDRLTTVERYFGTQQALDIEYQNRRKVSPDWELALENWVIYFEEECFDNQEENTENIFYAKNNVIYDAYWHITIGNDKFLYEMANHLFYENETGELDMKVPIEFFLKDIALGVALAYFFPKLEKEYEELRKQRPENITYESVIEDQQTAIVKELKKLKWKGELKEFAELIDSLINKNWTEIPHGELNAVVKTFCACFDFSGTKKKESSNTETSLLQYLKPSERETKIYSKRYKSKFNSILPNTSTK